MKLGSETGSLTNHIISRQTIGQPEPKVGMGATILSWTDRYAGTISEVLQFGTSVVITVREDTAKRTDTNGMSESQTYEIFTQSQWTCLSLQQEQGWGLEASPP